MSDDAISQDGQYVPARSLMDCGSMDYDMRKAASAAERGAGSAVPDAQYLYALFLYVGEAGVTVDRKTAAELFSLAASGEAVPLPSWRRRSRGTRRTSWRTS